MPRVSFVTWPKMKLNYGWLFDIQDYDDLHAWWDNVYKNIAQKDFNEAMKYKEGKAHANVLAQLAELWGLDLISALSRLQSDRGNGMAQVLDEHHRLFVNSVGGYFGWSDALQLSGTHDIDIWALPEESIRIIQWPGGEHFYAKIGNDDVVVDGEQKWETKAAAEAAGKKYLEGKRR